MQFFYEAVLEVNKANEDVLDSDDEGPKASGTEGEEGDAGGDGDTDGADNGRVSGTVWLGAVDAVSDLTKYNWREVFQMSAMEFFVFLKYHNYKMRKQELQIKKMYKK